MILPTISPVWYQIPSWKAVSSGVRKKIISYPRRHGKDVEDLCMAAWNAIKRKGTYYYIFPNRQWAKRVIWQTMIEIGGESRMMIDWAFPCEIVSRKVESDLMLELKNGSLFFMGGSDNLDFVGQGGQGYTLSEFSLHKSQVTSLLAPIISQSQAYLHMNGTLRGRDNQLYEMLMRNKNSADWHARWIRAQDTKLYCWVSDEMNVNPELLPLIGNTDPATGKLYCNCHGNPYENVQDMIDAGVCSYAFARQEYMNDVTSTVVGGYYGYELKAMEKRGGPKERDPFKEPVYTFWDIGGVNKDSDKTCIVFAHYDESTKQFFVIDYYENTGHLRGHYLEVLKKKRYHYGGHYLPHDAKRSNNWNGEGMAETSRKFGVEMRYVPKTNSITNDIEITRRGFAKTEFRDCRDVLILVDCLGRYHQSETTGTPCHRNNCKECQGASHGADAFRQMHMAGHLGLIKNYIKKPVVQDHYEECLDDYFLT